MLCIQLQGKTGGFSLSGVKTKLFGGDTPEQRDQKIDLLRQQIAENKLQLQQSQQATQ